MRIDEFAVNLNDLNRCVNELKKTADFSNS